MAHKSCYLRKYNAIFLPQRPVVVECRTRNRNNPGSNPHFAIVWKFGHFCSLHDASVDSAV